MSNASLPSIAGSSPWQRVAVPFMTRSDLLMCLVPISLFLSIVSLV
jgi:hypothetical protein